MTIHVHLIIGSETNPLFHIMCDFKSYTSRAPALHRRTRQRKPERMDAVDDETRRAEKSSNKDWQLWQRDNHLIELYNLDITKQKLAYLHLNPVVSGFVIKAEKYLYSIAVDYYSGKGLLEIRLLDGC